LPPPTDDKARQKRSRRRHKTCTHHSRHRITRSTASLDSTTALWGSASSSSQEDGEPPSQPPVPPAGSRIYFLPGKSQELLEGHIWEKHQAGPHQHRPSTKHLPPCHPGTATGPSLLLDQCRPHHHLQSGSPDFSRQDWETLPRAPPSLVGQNIPFLAYKEQELLEWHIYRKHQKDSVRPTLRAASAWQRNQPPFNSPKANAWHRPPTGPSVPSESTWAQTPRPPILTVVPQQERPQHLRQTLECSVQTTRACVRHTEPCQKRPEPRGRSPGYHQRSPTPCWLCPGPHLASAQPRKPSPGPCLPSSGSQSQSPQELLVVAREHVEVSKESLRLVLPPSPKAPSPAHLVVERPEEERATHQLHLCRAKCPSCPAPAPAKARLPLPHPVHRSKGHSRLRGQRKGQVGSAGPQATRRSTLSSWTDCMEPKTLQPPGRSPKTSPAGRPALLDPAFMGHRQEESPCLSEVRPERPVFVEPLPRPPCQTHTIIQSLDKEQAMQDLQLSLAKALEKGGSLKLVEYPVCLLCSQCNPSCQHPRAPHDPCLQVYPRMIVQDGQVRMTLGFHLKRKGIGGKESGLEPRQDASQVPPGKEQPPMLQRDDGWRSRAPRDESTKHPAHSPERRPGLANGNPVEKTNPRPGGPKAAPKTQRLNYTSASRSSTKPSKAVPAGEGLCFLKCLVLCFKRFWGKLKEKMKTPPQQASPENFWSPYKMEGSSSLTPEEEDQGESLWAALGRGNPSLQRIILSWDLKETYNEKIFIY
ncbi:hypothetical protein JRQ81_008355, partial [Phrynocephalus forsythii]